MIQTVGIAIPTYRHRDYLASTIRSAIEQTRRPDMIVVVDDHSDDGTAELAEEFPSVVVYRHDRRLGPTRTTADAIAGCVTEFVAVLDGDDVMRPQRIDRQLAAFSQNSALRIVGSLVQPIDSKGDVLGEPLGTPGRSFAAIDWARDGMLAGGSSLMVRAPFVNHDTRLYWASDWKFVLDNLSSDSTSCVLDEVLVDYRRHGGSVSTLHRANGLADHVLMCNLLLDGRFSPDVNREVRRQRAVKKCQLGECQLSTRSYGPASISLAASLVESHGRLARSVAASIRDGLRARRQ